MSAQSAAGDNGAASASAGDRPSATEVERDLVETLRKKFMLFILPEKTLRDVVPRCYGDNAPTILYDDIKWHVMGDNFDRYSAGEEEEDVGHMDTALFCDHVKVLASVPNGLALAVNTVVWVCEIHCSIDRDNNDIESYVQYCQTFDTALLAILKQALANEHFVYEFETAAGIMDEIMYARKDQNAVTWNSAKNKNLPSNPCFLETAAYLIEWHGKRTGPLLSEKIAGHLLPPELVEIIEDFYEAQSQHQSHRLRDGQIDIDEFDLDDDVVYPRSADRSADWLWSGEVEQKGTKWLKVHEAPDVQEKAPRSAV